MLRAGEGLASRYQASTPLAFLRGQARLFTARPRMNVRAPRTGQHCLGRKITGSTVGNNRHGQTGGKKRLAGVTGTKARSLLSGPASFCSLVTQREKVPAVVSLHRPHCSLSSDPEPGVRPRGRGSPARAAQGVISSFP